MTTPQIIMIVIAVGLVGFFGYRYFLEDRIKARRKIKKTKTERPVSSTEPTKPSEK